MTPNRTALLAAMSCMIAMTDRPSNQQGWVDAREISRLLPSGDAHGGSIIHFQDGTVWNTVENPTTLKASMDEAMRACDEARAMLEKEGLETAMRLEALTALQTSGGHNPNVHEHQHEREHEVDIPVGRTSRPRGNPMPGGPRLGVTNLRDLLRSGRILVLQGDDEEAPRNREGGGGRSITAVLTNLDNLDNLDQILRGRLAG